MAHHIVIAQSEVTAIALRGILQICERGRTGQSFVADTDDVSIIVLTDLIGPDDGGTNAYELLVRRVEHAGRMADGSLAVNQIVAIVDAVRPSQMVVTSEQGGWHELVGMLILTFPEIKWVFAELLDAPASFPAEAHSLTALLTSPRRDPLFDPTGLREWVRTRSSTVLQGQGRDIRLPARSQVAAVIDEEKAYAYFHGYAAYRYGYRVDVVTSWKLMQALFDSQQPSEPHGYALLLEDMSLNFPDRPDHVHILRLGRDGRAGRLRKLDSESNLENSKLRILVTGGQASANSDVLTSNIEYLKGKVIGSGRYCPKPVGGMIDFWRRSQRGSYDSDNHVGNRIGNAEGFSWPPRGEAMRSETASVGHGAHGKLLLIAETLLRRAETFRSSACTLKDYVKGALATCDAAELLSGLTPTLTFSALALKHEFEVRADCAFLGVGYRLDVRPRAEEIEEEVTSISHFFASETRETFSLGTCVAIMNRLIPVYRAAGQIEEEQQALAALRSWHRQLRVRGSDNPLSWIGHVILWYAEILMTSFGIFAIAATCWLLGLTGLWYLANGGRAMEAMTGTFGSFFGGGAVGIASDVTWWLITISCTTIVVGAFHIGILLSYLYSLISRR